MKIASRKKKIPSIANGIPYAAPKRPIRPGHSKPISNDRIVPETAPTAKVTAMIRVQRRARRRASASSCRIARQLAISRIVGKATPRQARMMWKPRVTAIWSRAASRLAGGRGSRASNIARRLLLAARLQEDDRRLLGQGRHRDLELGLGRAGCATHLVEELGQGFLAVPLVLADGHRDDDPGIQLRDQLGGPGGAQVAADRYAGDVDRADIPELLFGQQVADVTQVDRVHLVQLDHERGLPAVVVAALVVAVGPDSGQEDVPDLVFAGSIEDEGVLEAAGNERLAVTRRGALGPRQRGIVGVAVGHDLGGDSAARRPDDGLVRIGDDDCVTAFEPDAGAPVPGEFHWPDSDRCRSPAPQPRVVPELAGKRETGSACPIGAPGRREGGGTRPTVPALTVWRGDSATTRRLIKKGTRSIGDAPRGDRPRAR